MFQPKNIITRLHENAFVFHALFSGLEEKQIHWRPAPGKWSFLEVLCHLYDEEREDFRTRVDHALNQKGDWPPIDPVGWVTTRNYAAADFSQKLEDLLHERRKSIDWLKNLQTPDWELFYDHPQIGRLSAEDMLRNWLAHDLLHIRQVNRMHWAYFAQGANKVALDYAGTW